MTENILIPEVSFEYVPVINFSMQQNHVPVVRRLSVRNISESDLRNIKIEISTEPEFAVVWSRRIEILQKNESIDLETVDIKLSTKYLSELTERIAGIFTIKITNDEAILYKESYNVDILAYDQWSGISILPEMLSAFITPNHSEIPKIIKRASAILEGWTGNPSFDEYQTKNPDRVKKQMAAIYEAIAEKQIIYCTTPASFEETGQRIRILDSIFTQQMGNCLDLSLLYASCLEAVGINPLIMIIKGHAFAGAWVINESFADSVNDDLSLLTKRIADGINEVVVVEATCMNAGQKSSFDNAIKAADNHLLKEDDFILFIDVKRSRFSGIRPLPLRIRTNAGWEVVEQILPTRDSETPDEIVAGDKIINVEHIDTSKQQMWERKLLDLSLRNNLLNIHISKNTVQLISVNLGKLEDQLAAGNEFQVLPKPADWDNPLRSSGVYQSLNLSDPITDLVKQELSQKRLRSYLTDIELSGSLLSLYRSSRLSLEENGANTLYIALGLLKWYETPLSEKPRFAPILLLPVEIIRKTAQKSYIIRSREEDAIMNITLLEMIRQDFGINIGGLETLPKDESGVDVKLIFNIVRQSIMSQSKWDVEEQAFLGTFSFSKFIMWNDIHSNSAKLSKNNVVASLIAGKMNWEDTETVADDFQFDRHYHPSEIALPISVDSSQLDAICTAAENKSFVLHGPPGTGKSQTITNIIANSLYKGKKVLFVAEKMAALSVVQSRLEAIGLSPFCLELHSNKAKKSSVLEQLKSTIEISKTGTSEQFTSEAERLHLLRIELNDYVETLHKIYSFGYSLYDIFMGYAQVIGAPDKISFDDETISALTRDQIVKWSDVAEELQVIGEICSHPHNHPLAAIEIIQYTQALKNESKTLITAYLEGLKDFKAVVANLIVKLKIELVFSNDEQFRRLQTIIDLLVSLPDTPPEMIRVDNIEQIFSQLNDAIVHGKKRDELRRTLLAAYNKNILSFNADGCLAEWNLSSQKWFLPKMLKQNSISKSLKQISIKNTIDKSRVPELLQLIIDFKAEQEYIDNNASFLSSLLGFLWQGGNCDWDKISSICETLIKLNREVITLLESSAKAKEWRTIISKELGEGSRIFASLYGNYFAQYGTLYNQVIEREKRMQEMFGIDFRKLKDTSINRIDNCGVHAKAWLENIEKLRDWVNWNQTKTKAINIGLSPLVMAYENGCFDSKDVVGCFKKGLFRSCAEYIFAKEASLSSFNGQLFEEKIKRFREISKHFEELTKQELYTKLASKIPVSTQEASNSSEIGILQRAIRNGGRGLSIRKLFDSIPNLLPRMSPCMLMSPISVAQYFDASTTKFDLVIFDEASQMPTCEAVGAIARGTQVIIVGDPKQMPPTNFFSSNRIEEDNENEDLESILDDCLALSMPSKYLLWHYRSKHESLIAFSNSKYYDNKLMTFPSPDDITTKVTYVNVEGYYDRSKTRQNQFEAKAIVDEIVRRLSDPVLSKRTIGVVTFSSVQQLLIDDMLHEVLKTNPVLEAIAMESSEPLFIKNLENVQGDERDVILFSVGYGPDKEGKVNLNFGPLNRKGGERRLNVAVSRARYEMKVFSTLKADQIDITRTSSDGVAGLKDFLAYAEKGRAILGYRNPGSIIRATEFVKLISEQIKAYGYGVNVNIGCSGYRIDIGVIDPKNPSKYILGILCDGHNYSIAKTARDREIVQYDVLKLLGWNIHKIWSTDWWENPDSVIKGILKALSQIESNITAESEFLAEPLMASVGAQHPREEIVLNKSFQPAEPIISPTSLLATKYEMCNLRIISSLSSDDFLQYSNEQKIKDQILEVLNAEAPISKDLLCQRVLSAWGITRLGTRINVQFELLFSALKLKRTEIDNKTFFWNNSQNPKQYDIYRIPKKEIEKRNAEDLPPEEIANAIKDVLANQISLPKEDLIRETAKVFGFARIGNNVEAAFSRGIISAISKGYAVEENKRIVFKE